MIICLENIFRVFFFEWLLTTGITVKQMTYDLKSLNQNEDSFQITPQKRVVGTHSMHLFEMFQ